MPNTTALSHTVKPLRWRLLVGLLCVLAVLAAACGDDSDDSDSVSAPSGSDAPSQGDDSGGDDTAGDASADDDSASDASGDDSSDGDSAGDAMAASGAPYGTLDYLGWEGYDTFFGAIEETISDLGVDFNSAYIATGADIAQRFAAGGGSGVDLLAWTTANHRLNREVEGVLTPITVEEVPNLVNLMDVFADDTWGHFKDENGDWVAIPFSFAPLGITYDSTKVSPTSLADLLDPVYTGLLGIPDVPPLHIQAGAAALGYKAEDVTPEQLDEIIEFIAPIFAQADAISPSFGDIIGLLASGEIVAAYGGYPGLGAFTENPDIVTVFPTEGTSGFVEVYSIPAGADNREGALAFINAMLDPETNAALNEAFAQATPIVDAVPLMSQANKALYPYDNLDEFFAANPITGLPYGDNGAITMGDFIEAYGALVAGG